MSNHITFNSRHIPAIKSGDKTKTIRPAAQTYPDVGERFDLVDGDGDKFGESVVESKEIWTARGIVHGSIDGHRNYNTLEELRTEMQEYYPDIAISSTTPFWVIQMAQVNNE